MLAAIVYKLQWLPVSSKDADKVLFWSVWSIYIYLYFKEGSVRIQTWIFSDPAARLQKTLLRCWFFKKYKMCILFSAIWKKTHSNLWVFSNLHNFKCYLPIKLQTQRLWLTIFSCFKQNRIISLFMSFCRATLNTGCYTKDRSRRPSHSTHIPLSDTSPCDIKFFYVHFPFSGSWKAWLIINLMIRNTEDHHQCVAILWA